MAVASNVQSNRAASGRSAPKLVPLGLLAGKPAIPLDRPVTSLGGRENCRIHLISRSVSQHHALLVNSNGGTYICDLASREGVLVNDIAVRNQQLKTGDRIQIGKFLFEFRGVKNAPPPDSSDPAPATIQIQSHEPVAIEDKTLLIGRREDADLSLSTDGDVSGLHAIIFPVSGQWYLRDLGSRTGTKINGKPIHQENLNFGDEIQIGKAVLRFEPNAASAVIEPVEDVDSADHLSGLFSPEISPEIETIPQLDAEPAIEPPLAEALPAETEEVLPPATEVAVEPADDLAAPRRSWRSELAKKSLPLDEKPPAQSETPQVPEPVQEEQDAIPDIVAEPEEPVADIAEPELAAPAHEEHEHDDLELVSEHVEPPAENVVPEIVESPVEVDEHPPLDIAVEHPEPVEVAAAEPPAPALDEPIQVAPEEIASTEAAPVEVAPAEPAMEVASDTSDSSIHAELDEFIEVLDRSRGELDDAVANIEPVDLNSPPQNTSAPQETTDMPLETGDSRDVEILDHTEPTLESALDIQPGVETPAVQDSDAGSPQVPLSDTTFGRAVEEFTGPSTGPIIEPVAEEPTVASPEPAEVQPLEEISDVGELEEFVAMPEDVPADAADAFVDLSELEDATLPEPESTIVEPPAQQEEPEEMVSGFALEEEQAPALPIEQLPAPAESLQDEAPPTDLDDLELAEEEPAVAQAPVQAQTPPAVVPPLAQREAPEDVASGFEMEEEPAPALPIEQLPAPAESLQDEAPPTDLDDLELAEEEPAVAQSPVEAQTPPAVIPPVPPAPAAPSAPEKKSTPPLFGFSFDGASFIGGMPLKLKQAHAVAPNAPPAPAPKMAPAPVAKAAQTFDPKTSGISRLSTMKPPAPPVAPARPTGVEQKRQPGPVTERAARLPTPPGSAPHRKPLATPPWAPPPRRGVSAPAHEPMSLTNLTFGSDGPSEPPTIPTLMDDVAVPPLARPIRPPAPTRRSLSTAFDGLTGEVDQTQTADVFSQITAPISASSFTLAPGNIEDFASDEITRSPVPQSFGAPLKLKVPPGGAVAPPNPPGASPSNGQGRPKTALARTSPARVPILLGLMVLLIAGTWALVYVYFPHYSRVTGRLGFTNVDRASMAEQRTFEIEQIARLGSEDVRSVAKALLTSQNNPPGFLDDAIRFDQAINKQGNAHFDGPNLEMVTQSSDEGAGAQMTALLTALKQKDADLVDAQARAKAAVDSAKFAVDKATNHLEEINSQIKVLQAAGDQRPDPTELAKEEADATRLAKSSDDAKAARVETQLAWETLRQADTSKPIDPETDAQLVQLRKQLTDLNEQIAKLKAPEIPPPSPAYPAGPVTAQPPTAADTNANSELIKQLQSQADATRSQISLRTAIVQADQRLSPQQREVNRQKAVEDLTIKLARLQSTEADAVAAANAAANTATQTRKKLENAQLALTQMDELPRQQTAAEADLKARSDEQAEQQKLLDLCIIPSGDPQVNVEPMPDQRPIIAGIGSGVFLFVFSYMIVQAARGPAKIAAPLPVSPIPESTQPDSVDPAANATTEPPATNPPQKDQEAVTI